MQSIRSASAASAVASAIASSGSISPNSTTFGLSGVMQVAHSGVGVPSASIRLTSSYPTLPPHISQTHHSIEPCTSITFSEPAARWRRSMFWVMTPRTIPRRSSSATASWAGFGWISESIAKRCP